MPPIDECLRAAENEPKLAALGGAYLKMLLRRAQADLREELRAGRGGDRAALLAEIIRRAANAAAADEPHLRPVVNATGVVLHTNLGRAILAESAIEAIEMAARSAVNLEYDLESGERGDRDAIVEEVLCALTGAEAATVVNNNAAAVLLVLGTLALGREVVVSRGELIEIGGAFRIPDVMTRAGARLREVGTTNRTHPRDFADAIGPDTALLMKVHPSNYRIVGFTSDVPLEELVRIGREQGIDVVEDLGAGALVDLSRYGLPPRADYRRSDCGGCRDCDFFRRQAARWSAIRTRRRAAESDREAQSESPSPRAPMRQAHARGARSDAQNLSALGGRCR